MHDERERPLNPEDAKVVILAPDGNYYTPEELPDHMTRGALLALVATQRQATVNLVNLMRTVISMFVRELGAAIEREDEESIELLSMQLQAIGGFMDNEGLMPRDVFAAQVEAGLLVRLGQITEEEFYRRADAAWQSSQSGTVEGEKFIPKEVMAARKTASPKREAGSASAALNRLFGLQPRKA
jgi:hypothetical protein